MSDVGSQLINPSMIPVIATQCDALQQDAAQLRKHGERVTRTGERIHEHWQKLRPHYEAPEGEQLCYATARPRSKATVAGNHLIQASEHLWTFAGELKPKVERLEYLRREAQEFVAWANRYPTDWPRRSYPSGELLTAIVTSEELGGTVNSYLGTEVAKVVNAIRRLQDHYANAIKNLVDTTVLPPLEAPPPNVNRHDRDSVAPPDWRRGDYEHLPWGGYVVPPTSAIPGPLRIQLGLHQANLDGLLFFPKLAGLNIQVDLTGRAGILKADAGLDVARGAWTGVGRLGMALGGGGALGSLASYTRSTTRDMNLSTLKAFGGGFIASDEKDPWMRTGKIMSSVGSLFSPSPVKGPAGALAKAGAQLGAKGGLGLNIAGRAMRIPDLLINRNWLSGNDLSVGNLEVKRTVTPDHPFPLGPKAPTGRYSISRITNEPPFPLGPKAGSSSPGATAPDSPAPTTKHPYPDATPTPEPAPASHRPNLPTGGGHEQGPAISPEAHKNLQALDKAIAEEPQLPRRQQIRNILRDMIQEARRTAVPVHQDGKEYLKNLPTDIAQKGPVDHATHLPADFVDKVDEDTRRYVLEFLRRHPEIAELLGVPGQPAR